MRSRFRLLVVVLLLLGLIFILTGLNVVIFHTREGIHGYMEQTGKKPVYFTPKRRLNDVQTDVPGTLARVGRENDYIQRIVYNRVPKCGSRSILTLFKGMATKNKFQLLVPERNYPYQLEITEQEKITELVSSLRPPFLYPRHMLYFDVEAFGGPPVGYINLIRDPISRAVSHFYFRRYGDNILNRSRVKTGIKYANMTYDECVLKRIPECVGKWGVFFIVPFFCGNEMKCLFPSRWALERAKRNVEKYLVVGILEEYDDFIKVLEKLLPNFFKGAYNQSKIPDSYVKGKSKLSLTRMKKKPSEKVIAISRNNMKFEYEFYNFIKERFHKLKRSLGIK